jgi:hypothetical protein
MMYLLGSAAIVAKQLRTYLKNGRIVVSEVTDPQIWEAVNVDPSMRSPTTPSEVARSFMNRIQGGRKDLTAYIFVRKSDWALVVHFRTKAAMTAITTNAIVKAVMESWLNHSHSHPKAEMNNASSRNPDFTNNNSDQDFGGRQPDRGFQGRDRSYHDRGVIRDRAPRNNGAGRVTLTGKLIQTGNGEAIVIKFKLWMFQVNLLVNIPYDGEQTAPVYAEIVSEPVKTADVVSCVMQPDTRTDDDSDE